MWYVLSLVLALFVAACDSNEAPPEEGHHPHSAALFLDGVDVTDDLVLPAGETVRVEVRFYDDVGNQITGIEDEHFAALTFTPSTLATTADVDGNHFLKDVTAQGEIAEGTYSIGYGHDAAADEESFGPYAVRVVATGS